MLHNKFVKHFFIHQFTGLLKKKPEEFDELSKEVENFSSRLEAKVKAVVNETTARLTADFEKNDALLKANLEGEKNVLREHLGDVHWIIGCFCFSRFNPCSSICLTIKC